MTAHGRRLPEVHFLISNPLRFQDPAGRNLDIDPAHPTNFSAEYEVLQELHQKGKIKLRIRIATRAVFEKALETADVVHYSGHGAPDGLLLEGDQGESYCFTQKCMKTALKSELAKVQLLVLNCCHGAHAVCGHVRCFTIFTDDKISQNNAKVFARSFYTNLFELDNPIDVAFRRTTHPGYDMRESPLSDGTAQLQLGEAEPEGSTDEADTNMLPVTPFFCNGPKPVSLYGRRPLMHALFTYLVSGKQLAQLDGPAGVGTSSVARFVGQYLAEHNHHTVQDGVYVISIPRHVELACDLDAPSAALYFRLKEPVWRIVASTVLGGEDIRSEADLFAALNEGSGLPGRRLIIFDDCTDETDWDDKKHWLELYADEAQEPFVTEPMTSSPGSALPRNTKDGHPGSSPVRRRRCTLAARPLAEKTETLRGIADACFRLTEEVADAVKNFAHRVTENTHKVKVITCGRLGRSRRGDGNIIVGSDHDGERGGGRGLSHAPDGADSPVRMHSESEPSVRASEHGRSDGSIGRSTSLGGLKLRRERSQPPGVFVVRPLCTEGQTRSRASRDLFRANSGVRTYTAAELECLIDPQLRGKMTPQRLAQEVETALDMHIDSIAHQLGDLPAKLVCAARKWRETPEASLGEVILRASAPEELRAIEAQVGTAGAWQSHRLPVLAIWQFLAADGGVRPDLCVAATWLWYQNVNPKQSMKLAEGRFSCPVLIDELRTRFLRGVADPTTTPIASGGGRGGGGGDGDGDDATSRFGAEFEPRTMLESLEQWLQASRHSHCRIENDMPLCVFREAWRWFQRTEHTIQAVRAQWQRGLIHGLTSNIASRLQGACTDNNFDKQIVRLSKEAGYLTRTWVHLQESKSGDTTAKLTSGRISVCQTTAGGWQYTYHEHTASSLEELFGLCNITATWVPIPSRHG